MSRRRGRRAALALLLAGLFGGAATAQVAPCPRAETLGTARVLEIDAGAGVFVGRKSYPETLPLAVGEVVLTFDDGPAGATTDAVLTALAEQCVRATFFVVGEMAVARPAQVHRIAAAGHSIGHHTMTHPILATLAHDAAAREIAAGWRAVDTILSGRAGPRPVTPFFRYPGFAGTAALDAELRAAGIAVFGADLWGSDWAITDAEQLLTTVLTRLEAAGGGIVLLHDTKKATAAMLPRLLAEMRTRGYRIVHIVAKPAP